MKETPTVKRKRMGECRAEDESCCFCGILHSETGERWDKWLVRSAIKKTAGIKLLLVDEKGRCARSWQCTIRRLVRCRRCFFVSRRSSLGGPLVRIEPEIFISSLSSFGLTNSVTIVRISFERFSFHQHFTFHIRSEPYLNSVSLIFFFENGQELFISLGMASRWDKNDSLSNNATCMHCTCTRTDT